MGAVSKFDPRSSQCGAKGRRSGEPCQRWVIGGGRCYLHGGRTPGAVRAREERLALMDARLSPTLPTGRTAGEMLMSAADDVLTVIDHIKGQLATPAEIDPNALEALGRWPDRAARIAKLITESRADESLIEQRERVNRAQAAVMVTAVAAALECLDLTPEQQRQVPGAVRAALASVNAAEAEPLPGEVIGRE